MKRFYDDPRYKAWRAKVRKRDSYMCQWPNCGSRIKLQAHHIRRWADSVLLRFNVDNGITLCRKHHDRIKGKEVHYARFLMLLVQNVKKKN